MVLATPRVQCLTQQNVSRCATELLVVTKYLPVASSDNSRRPQLFTASFYFSWVNAHIARTQRYVFCFVCRGSQSRLAGGNGANYLARMLPPGRVAREMMALLWLRTPPKFKDGLQGCGRHLGYLGAV